MFRKIPFKERNTTVFRELKKEFSPQVKAVDSLAKGILDRYSKVIFCAMILLIVTSFILTFFVLKPEERTQSENFEKELYGIPEGLGGEFSALQNLSSRAVKMAELKAEIDRIISQESISKGDSAYLEKAIEQLQYFNKQSKEDEH
ncbi:hypothetical protein SYJ56_04655 [Algoriphagus sp. D3-2-R+10]|uniref:hypothetical protein n=1 Tax=Algoriphagus aurantiacus TaxID=3103948 RepID=UPI002B3EEBCA|nr:hypothetical protein [Algoriphagus sp. D3-2-R+10]MEB2774583.1 hypothetical protein [Algoriphagus sp. D3-2-R+10]